MPLMMKPRGVHAASTELFSQLYYSHLSIHCTLCLVHTLTRTLQCSSNHIGSLANILQAALAAKAKDSGAFFPQHYLAHIISSTTMRLRQSPSTLLFLWVACALFVTAFVSSEEAVTSADGKELGPLPELSASPASKPGVDGIGTIDAPVDGKDGRPHLGPFVETGAERDRKKAKENSGDADIKKPLPEGVSTSDGPKIPETNDGVMDDPHRTGPKEGTRGTEGGISEKNKDRKEVDGAKAEKKPDPPKEVPPLPHSEQESLDPKAAKEDGKKETGVEDKEKQKELGGLEVISYILKAESGQLADLHLS